MAILAAMLAQVLVADLARADEALFRVQRVWTGGMGSPYTYPLEPATMGSAKAPPATAYVGSTTPARKVTLPNKFFSIMSLYYCVPGQCFPGYPVSGGYYSLWYGQGRFRPNNPYGGSAPASAYFKTTMAKSPTMYGSTISGYITNTWLPTAMFNPVTPTTTFAGCVIPGQPGSGCYDFNRAGVIRVEPGPNRFGGTIRVVSGPNRTFYQFISHEDFYPFLYKAYGIFIDPPTTDETDLGEFTSSGGVTRFRLTPLGQYKAKDAGGYYYSKHAAYLHTNIPWMTGRFEAYHPLGYYHSRRTYTGYDNRTPQGLKGNLSMVRARLVQTYLTSSDPTDPIVDNYHAIHNYRWTLFFVPEPGGLALVGAGIAAVLVLARFRRR